MSLEAGQVVDDKYRIVRLIGAGGMGAVYEGVNISIHRRVAIKVLNTTAAMNDDLVARFEREAQAAGRIGNDHILEVLDLGRLPSGDRYMVMEYLDGETLLDRMERQGKLSPDQILPLACQFLSALSAAHAAGIIHRDLKPENIFVLKEKAGRRDFVKLIDFGVSKFINLGPEASRVTRAGALIGTPCYLAPEQARGVGEVDVRSDIYAAGVILYEAVAGRLPYEGENFNDLLFKIALSDAPSPRSFEPSLDQGFEAIIVKAMARDPAARFQSVEDLRAALETWAEAHSISVSIVPVRSRRASIPEFPAIPSPSLPNIATPVDVSDEVALDADMEAAGLKATMLERLTSSQWARSQASDGPRRSPRSLLALGGAAGLAVIAAVLGIALSRSGNQTSGVGIVATASPTAGAASTTDAPRLSNAGAAVATASEPIPAMTTTAATSVATPPTATTVNPAPASERSPSTAPIASAARPGVRVPQSASAGAASTKPTPAAKPGKKATDFGY
jgi:serine/threonine-protein kinase